LGFDVVSYEFGTLNPLRFIGASEVA